MSRFTHALHQIAVQVFTEPNNHTTCPIRVLGVLGTAQGLGLSAYQVLYKGVLFDLQAYGAGMGLLLGALGVALAVKKDSQ